MTSKDQDKSKTYSHTQVSGAINQHTPSYWRLALPALGVRYAATFFKDWSNIKANKYFDAATGLWMLAVTAFFANRTRKDMKALFSEAVAYEMDKEPSDVGFKELLRSKNKCVMQARDNFIKYTSLRAFLNGSFFTSFFNWKPLPTWKALSETSAINLGMGLNSVYLTHEVLGRGRTFFEELQNFVYSKLDQSNALGEDIKPADLIGLFERNALDNSPDNAFKGKVDGHLWKQSQILFERMADLMNHTYQHKYDGERANFTLPKFIYLLGHNMIQLSNVPQTLAYIEVANSYGMDALKKVVKETKDGTPLVNALAQYPITLPASIAIEAPFAQANEVKGSKFTDLTPSKHNNLSLATPPAAYTDKVKTTEDINFLAV